MTIEKDKIILDNLEDKQILYDALTHYMYSEYKMGQSNHFAADIHAKISEKASDVVIDMRNEWKDLLD